VIDGTTSLAIGRGRQHAIAAAFTAERHGDLVVARRAPQLSAIAQENPGGVAFVVSEDGPVSCAMAVQGPRRRRPDRALRRR
jgi:hypothetical protein